MPCTDEMLMTRPNFCRYMCGSAALINRNGASTISVNSDRNRSGEKSTIELMLCTPALFTRMSASSCRFSSDATSRRSTAQACPPMSAARSFAPPSSTSATVTVAPRAASSLAQAAPIPLAPPVTRAARP